MVVPYAWRCLVCDASCPAGSDACVNCGFPSRATGVEIEAARRGRERRPSERLATQVTRRPPDMLDVLSDLGPVPSWRHLFVGSGFMLGMGGAIGLKAAWSLSMLGWSAAALAVGVTLAAIGLPAESLRSADAATSSVDEDAAPRD